MFNLYHSQGTCQAARQIDVLTMKIVAIGEFISRMSLRSLPEIAQEDQRHINLSRRVGFSSEMSDNKSVQNPSLPSVHIDEDLFRLVCFLQVRSIVFN